tara:strand:- start:421 stop:1338 length:918 start_codon:yes stop_codon:yes gene_type:complete
MSILGLSNNAFSTNIDPESSAEFYDVYTKDENGDGILDIILVAKEKYTGRIINMFIGSGGALPIGMNEFRKTIGISSDGDSNQIISTYAPGNEPSLDASWTKSGVGVLYGDITGDGWQDMFIIGNNNSNSYTLSWAKRLDQLIIQQILDDSQLKYYVANGYTLNLEDKNDDQMDDLVVSKDGNVVDIAFVTGNGVFYASDDSEEASRVTSQIAIDNLRFFAGIKDVDSIIDITSRNGAIRLQRIISTLGSEAFCEELNNIERTVPSRISINTAQYEAVITKNGEKSAFPILLARDRNGVWKIDQI